MLNKKNIEDIGMELIRMQTEYSGATQERKDEISRYRKSLTKKYTRRERKLISEWMKTRERIMKELCDYDPLSIMGMSKKTY